MAFTTTNIVWLYWLLIDMLFLLSHPTLRGAHGSVKLIESYQNH